MLLWPTSHWPSPSPPPAPSLPRPGRLGTGRLTCINPPHRINDCTRSFATHPASPLSTTLLARGLGAALHHLHCSSRYCYLSASEWCESQVLKWSQCIVYCLSCCVFLYLTHGSYAWHLKDILGQSQQFLNCSHSGFSITIRAVPISYIHIEYWSNMSKKIYL